MLLQTAVVHGKARIETLHVQLVSNGPEQVRGVAAKVDAVGAVGAELVHHAAVVGEDHVAVGALREQLDTVIGEVPGPTVFRLSHAPAEGFDARDLGGDDEVHEGVVEVRVLVHVEAQLCGAAQGDGDGEGAVGSDSG